MIDELPATLHRKRETGVVNLDSSKGRGTHWVAYAIKNNLIYYFDSFGNLKPPKQLIRYFQRGGTRDKRILYNYDTFQKYDTVICGQLCLEFLYKISEHLYESSKCRSRLR